MKQHILLPVIILILLILTQVSVFGQDETDCSIEALTDYLNENLSELEEDSLEYVYRSGELRIEFALDCAYQPTFDEIENQVERTLDLVPLSFIIAASSIGNDVDSALAEIESLHGDSFTGQLLYNGLEMGLDGAELGCSGCHNGEAAPVVEGTYTRTEEQRLILDEFADYSIERYLVESILHPSAYIVPDYESVQMPANYSGRLDAQQLADLVAYLESQDQLLDDESADSGESDLICDAISTIDCDTVLADFVGDATRGEILYTGQESTENDWVLGCAGCHTGGVIGPSTNGSWTRTIEERLTLEQFTDYSAERFVVESILIPGAYIPDTFVDGVMPVNYAEQLSYQDLADIIAYLQESG